MMMCQINAGKTIARRGKLLKFVAVGGYLVLFEFMCMRERNKLASTNKYPLR